MATGYEDRTEVSVFIAVARQDATEKMAVGMLDGMGGLWVRIERWWRRRATATALARLDDRMLRDIGLTRHQLSGIASGEIAPTVADDGMATDVEAASPAPYTVTAPSSNDNLQRSRAA